MLHTDFKCGEMPLNYYPRPQLRRDSWINLNGQWDFTVLHDKNARPGYYDRKILVPYPVESELSGIRETVKPEDFLWYQREFEIPEEWKKKRVLLHFDAVDYACKVWLNDILISEHKGGYLPFSVDISGYIEEKNVLTVCVSDPTDTAFQQRGKQSLHPRGIFYTPCSGIWQTVWLEAVAEHYITSLKMTPDVDHSLLFLTVFSDTEKSCSVEVYNRENKLVSKKVIQSNQEAEILIEELHLWSPEDPYLYDLRISMEDDTVSSYFGMRNYGLKSENGRKVLTLNKEKIFHLGDLDQGYWPESNLTPVSEEAMIFDITELKKLGFNTIRKHIKIEPLYWYYLCDKLGMIVWQDMIAGGNAKIFVDVYVKNFLHIPTDDTSQRSLKAAGRASEDVRKEFEEEYKGMIEHLYNSVSIACWVPFNEYWGQYNAAYFADLTRKMDPTRYVDHASGWVDMKKGDFASYHQYFKKLSLPKDLDERVFVISECGGFGYIAKGHVSDERVFSYGKFKTQEKLDERYRRFIEEEVLPLKKQGLSALIYTQLSDVEGELNGLLTYDRKVLKFDKEKMKKLNDSVTEN